MLNIQKINNNRYIQTINNGPIPKRQRLNNWNAYNITQFNNNNTNSNNGKLNNNKQ